MNDLTAISNEELYWRYRTQPDNGYAIRMEMDRRAGNLHSFILEQEKLIAFNILNRILEDVNYYDNENGWCLGCYEYKQHTLSCPFRQAKELVRG